MATPCGLGVGVIVRSEVAPANSGRGVLRPTEDCGGRLPALRALAMSLSVGARAGNHCFLQKPLVFNAGLIVDSVYRLIDSAYWLVRHFGFSRTALSSSSPQQQRSEP